MKINNCPNCGGKVEFSPNDKALKCEKCSSIFKIELNPPKEKRLVSEVALLNKDDAFKKWAEGKRTFHCENCGAEIVLNKYEMSTKCSYCNTASLVPTEKLPGLKPDAVIPFKISKNKANEQFKTKIKSKMFLPNDFKRNIPKTQIGATYLSSFSFAMDAFATYKGIKAVTRTIRTKEGYQTVTDYVPFSGTISRGFDNIVVECSDKINQNQIDSILPYYFKENYDYDDDFLMGYSVDYYDRNVADSTNIAKDIALNSLDRDIRLKHGNVTSLKIFPTYSNEKFHYVLLPLYFINFKYKDKQYLNLMNGQTGVTSGKTPRSATKITFFVLGIILLVIGVPLLIMILSSLT